MLTEAPSASPRRRKSSSVSDSPAASCLMSSQYGPSEPWFFRSTSARALCRPVNAKAVSSEASASFKAADEWD